MFLRLVFVVFLIYIIKHMIVKANYHDFFLVSLLFLLIIFSYVFIMYERNLIVIIIFLFGLIFFYLLRKPKSIDNNLIIVDGKINFLNMFKNNYSIDDLREDLSNNRNLRIKNIDCGILKDGKLFCYFDNSYYKGFPVSIIFNGLINYDGLKMINKNYKWMNNILEKRRVEYNEIFYAFYYRNSLYIIKK